MTRTARLSCAGVLLSLLSGCLGGAGEEVTGPDPGIIDFPIAYVKRPYPVDNQGIPVQPDLSDPLQTSVGGDLYIRDRSSLSAAETNITGAITQGQGDVRDVDVSFDGSKIIFSLRLFDNDPNNPPTPKWNIYEYEVDTGSVQKVMSDATSELGDDVDPHYLPDGRILFSSTRQVQSKAVLTTESLGKPVFSALDESEDGKAFVLHVMDENGTNGSIEQISFNQSHDFDPVVLSSGEIVFSRWDNMGPGNGAAHLYKMKHDGTNLELLYGGHSHDTGTGGSTVQFMQPRPMPNGRIMAIIQPFSGTFGGGNIVEIDVSSYIDIDQALAIYQGALTGPGQIAATLNNVVTDGAPSPAGRYSSIYPLWDGTNRMLVSKSFCGLDVSGTTRACIEPWLSDPNAQEIPPEYSIWMYDLGEDTEKPVVSAEPGVIITDVVAVQLRVLPAITTNTTLNPNWETEGVGALHIRSVYDFDGSFNDLGSATADIASLATSETAADQRPARFLRLVKAVGIPDPDDEDLAAPPDLTAQAFGPNRSLGMREILGYTPIEPDGSVMVKVPANVPFTIEVLDQAGRRIGARHDNWQQVLPGETLECTGCHSHQTQNNATPLPHGRPDAQAAPANQGAGATLPLPMPSGLRTVPLLFALNGETMAKVRYNRCNLDLVGCIASTASIAPTVDPVYDDIWTDPADGGVTVNGSFSYLYAAMVGAGGIYATADDAPVTAACQSTWQKSCRTVINYSAHVHSLWAKDRGANTCTNCHSTRDAANAIQVPAGQLNLSDNNLTDDPTIIDNGQEHAYRELLFNDTELVLNGAILEERLVDSGQVDINGNPILVPVNVTPSMTANGARVSYFMEKITNSELDAGRALSGTVDHSTFMTDAELRLVAEWLDIGAQYYNNPFDPNAPQN